MSQEQKMKNRTPIPIEQAAVVLATEQSAWGQVRVSEALKQRGLSISPAGVHCVWRRLEKAKSDKEAHVPLR